MKYVYGLDIGGTNIKIGLFDYDETNLIMTSEIPTPQSEQSKSIFVSIINEMTRINDIYKIGFENVWGIGVAIPCPVKNGYVIACPNIKWTDLDIAAQFNKFLNREIRVAVANDANLAAYGENMSLDMPFSNVIFYTMGTGIGGGIIINGQLIEGSLGMAGELGHMPITKGIKETCGCGSRGCLEQLCGTKAMINHANELLNSEKSLLSEIQDFTIKDIFDAAKQNDDVAIKVVDRVGKFMGLSASIMSASLDPDAFIIGGGVSKAGDFLLDKIVYQYKKHARFNTKNIPFILAKTGNLAGVIGAAYYVKNKI